MSETERVREALESRFRLLRERISEIDRVLREPEDEDIEEQALDLVDDHALECLGEAGHQEMELIQDALQRIAQGLYGKCRVCGRRIPRRRLEALPHATTCTRCALAAA